MRFQRPIIPLAQTAVDVTGSIATVLPAMKQSAVASLSVSGSAFQVLMALNSAPMIKIGRKIIPFGVELTTALTQNFVGYVSPSAAITTVVQSLIERMAQEANVTLANVASTLTVLPSVTQSSAAKLVNIALAVTVLPSVTSITRVTLTNVAHAKTVLPSLLTPSLDCVVAIQARSLMVLPLLEQLLQVTEGYVTPSAAIKTVLPKLILRAFAEAADPLLRQLIDPKYLDFPFSTRQTFFQPDHETMDMLRKKPKK